MDSFLGRYPFPLDPFQEEAIAHLDAGRSVLVSAPTGTGKTVVAEYAIHLCRARGQKSIYTSPIKALSNQKFRQLKLAYSSEVGLLTGDIVENPDGRILVMTTEVLRNMLLQDAPSLTQVGAVVFDEVHFLSDPTRGAAWEESIVCCPRQIQLVCLSATVANAREVADWIESVHGPTGLVTHDERAVPLAHYYFVDAELQLMVDDKGRPVRRIPPLGGEARRGAQVDSVGRSGRAGAVRAEPTSQDILRVLAAKDMLPAIYFLFSRREVEQAALDCSRFRLARGSARAVISERLRSLRARLSPEDRELGQFLLLERLLQAGIGIHHAGLLPALKVLVEDLFGSGLLGVVFATDTLSLGINMPARTVVIGDFSKFDGESRRLLTATEYRQLTGRAGRRGIDVRGAAVVPYSPWVTAEEAFSRVTGPLDPIVSAYEVHYNTLLSLWQNASRLAGDERVAAVASHSLRTFQQDTAIRSLRDRRRSVEAAAASPAFDCPFGVPDEIDRHDGLRRALPRLKRSLARAEARVADIRALAESPSWAAARGTVRRALQSYVGGEVVHVQNRGWCVYLGRAVSSPGVAVIVDGSSIATLKRYDAIDYLDSADEGRARTIELRADLTKLIAEIGDEGQPLDARIGREISLAIDALCLPDVAAIAAAEREARLLRLSEPLTRAEQGVAEAARELDQAEGAVESSPCSGCPVLSLHREKLTTSREARGEVDQLTGRIDRLVSLRTRQLTESIRGIARVLESLGYLDRGVVTPKGRMLREIYDENGLTIVEAISRGLFNACSPPELAESLSWFAYDRDRFSIRGSPLPRRLVDIRDRLAMLEAEVLRAEADHGIRLSTGFSRQFSGVALSWARGDSLASITDRTNLAEGDVMMALNKTLDLLRQLRDMFFRQAPQSKLIQRIEEADRLMRRGIVEQSARMALEGALPIGDGSSLEPE